MRRSYLFILLLCAFAFAAADGALAAYYDEGHTGDSWEDAYIIDSAEDLKDMREMLSGNPLPSTGKYYKLASNISIELKDWSYSGGYIPYFHGHFDG